MDYIFYVMAGISTILTLGLITEVVERSVNRKTNLNTRLETNARPKPSLFVIVFLTLLWWSGTWIVFQFRQDISKDEEWLAHLQQSNPAAYQREMERRNPSKHCGTKGDVRTFVEEYVKGKLKSPQTAQFDNWEVTDMDCGNFYVRATVDAQNGFGALIRQAFSMKLTKKGDRWLIETFFFIPEGV